MKPAKILVISFSQSGQLSQIMTSFLAPLRENTEIGIVETVLEPLPPFPFPWSAYQFLDVFPESDQLISRPLGGLKADLRQDFDLVIIAYQVWYLSPSIPISSFLRSPTAKTLLKNRRVLTVVACRNMWYRAHELVKKYLHEVDAQLIGHVVLTDKALNLVSVVTVVYWMLSGRKDRLLGLFPKPGISEEDIRRCSVFGSLIASTLSHPFALDIQNCLNQAGACRVVPHLLLLENAASRAFQVWSSLILRTGGRSPLRRRALVVAFGLYLACGIAILSPLLLVIFYVTYPLRRRAVQRRVDRVYRY
jgi:hypothetical protein